MKLVSKLLALGATASLATSAFGALVTVSSDITTNTQWVASNEYILEGIIYVTNGAVLDIAPGTIVRGQPRVNQTLDTAGGLIVTRGSKIQARGTAASPIIFTTAAKLVPDADPATSDIVRWDGTGTFLDASPKTTPLAPLLDLDGDGSADDKVMRLWGGIALGGYAMTNNYEDVNGDTVPEDGEGLMEGIVDPKSTYGGLDDEDSSGSMTYVSIRHGGDGIQVAKELNALTLYACGSETTINNIDVYCTSDDGVEVFGGTVNLKNLNITYADDDGLDTDEGYRGTAQFVFVLQGFGYGDKGMELDGDDWDEGQALAPLFPTNDVQIRNATIISRVGKNATDIRNGFNGSLINSIVYKDGAVSDTGISISGLGTGDVAPSPQDYFAAGDLQIRNVTTYGFATNYSAVAGAIALSTTGGVTGTYEGTGIPSVYYQATNNRGSNSPTFNPGFSIVHGTSVNAVPTGGPGAIAVTQPADAVRDPAVFTSYRGAFDPNAAQQWTFGWTALNIAGILAN